MSTELRLSKFGRVLGTRLAGKAVREELLRLRATRPGQDIDIDCSDVQLVTASFADEAFGKLPPPLPTSPPSKIRFRGCNETVLAVISYIVGRRRRSP